MSTAASLVNVVISVDDENLSRIDEVMKELQVAGLSVNKVLSTVGTITGAVESSRINKLRSIRGVAAVEVSRQYRVPPPRSEIQ